MASKKPFRLRLPARKVTSLAEAKRIIKALDEQACRLIEIFANHGFVTGGATLPMTTEILCKSFREVCEKNEELRKQVAFLTEGHDISNRRRSM